MKKYLLVLICLFFLIIRLYKIGEIPASVYWDEASIGYNAYSISQTGKDEWGKFLPIHFRAFGEFKLPVYIYSVVPFVKFFGLNEFSVRFPAVLFSLGVIIITCFLAKKVSGKTNVGLLSSFFVSISPWFFIFSRTGYEATAGLMFYLLAIYLFLSFAKNSWYIFFSALSFILSIYSYNSFRIIIPLTLPILIVFELNNLKKLKQQIPLLILSVTFLIVSVVPMYKLYVYDAGISRFQTVSASSPTFLKNYFSHFSLSFLMNGDKNLRSQQPGFGEIYISDIALILFGMIYIIGSKSKYKFLPVILLLLAPIPASLTKESPHALRSISEVPFISILMSFGILFFWETKNAIVKYVSLNLVLVGLFSSAYYFYNFVTLYPKVSSQDWQYGYKRIYSDFEDQFSKYNRIIISDEYAQPYIFGLFYLKYDPNKFRETVVRNSVDNWGFSTVSSFDKFKFGKIKNLVDKDVKNSLIFASEKEKLPDINPIDTIKFLNGEVAFWVYK